MDEPFSALDPIRGNNCKTWSYGYARYRNTIVFVTHDMNEALKLGDGSVSCNTVGVQVDTPAALAQHPVNDFVRNFGASRAKNVYDVYVKCRAYSGLSHRKPGVASGRIQSLDVQAVTHRLTALTDHDYVAVTEENRVVGYLDSQRIVAYLSQHEEVS